MERVHFVVRAPQSLLEGQGGVMSDPHDLSSELSRVDLALEEEEELPEEVLCHIFYFLRVSELGLASRVCHRWQHVVWHRLRHLEFDRKDLVDDEVLVHLNEVSPELTSLKISRCLGIRDSSAFAFLAMRHLRTLHVDYCDWITDSLLLHLKDHPTLTELSIVAACRITLTEALLNPSLRTLCLSACRGLEKTAMAHIAALPHLTALDLSDASASLGLAEGLSVLGDQASALTHLNLFRSALNDEHLTHIGKIFGLKYLNLSQNAEITSGGVEHLAALTKLVSLNLASCTNITDRASCILATFTRLRFLNLANTGFVDDGLGALVPLPQLQILRATCARSSFSLLSGLAQSPYLSCLSLTDSKFDPSDAYLLGSLHSLTELNVASSIGLNESIFFDALARLSQLQSLDISSINAVTYAGVAKLKGLPRLAKLHLDWCLQLGDAIGQTLLAFPMLTHLSLRSCKCLSDQALPDLLRLPKLEVLDLSYCVGINLRDLKLQKLRFKVIV